MSESNTGTTASEAPPVQQPSETLGQGVTKGELTYSTSTLTKATATLD